MRETALVVLALAGIYWCARIHQADATYRRVRDIEPDVADPARRAERVTGLTAAIDTDGLDALYRFRRGGSYYAEGTSEGYRRAIVEFREAARLAPAWFEPQYWWGMAMLALGRPDEEEVAVGRLDRARELSPYNVDLSQRLGGYWTWRWSRSRRPEHLRRAFRSIHELRLVEPEATLKAFTSILASPVLRFEDLEAIVAEGDVEQRRTLARALDAAQRYRWSAGVHEGVRARLGDDAFEDWLALARARAELHEDEAAFAALRRHLERLAPDLEAATSDVEALFEGARRPDAGAVFCRDAAERWPDATELIRLEGELALAAGDPRAGLAAYRRYFEKVRDDPRAFALAARCHEALGELGLALAHVRLALQLRPDAAADRALEARLIERGAE